MIESDTAIAILDFLPSENPFHYNFCLFRIFSTPADKGQRGRERVWTWAQLKHISSSSTRGSMGGLGYEGRSNATQRT